ncbi:MAG: biopolymer transporter ExbD [Bdellovibrionales bacterium]|nr:biopolymer transporter ExbD [Bdellovibrionales bacterium]
MKTQNKDVNFEINLLPVISLLAVCISFLLLTTVWIHIGTLDVKQALGEATEQEKAEEHPALWVTFEQSGDLILQMKNVKDKSLAKAVRFAKPQSDQWKTLENYTASLRDRLPEVKMALVFPDRKTPYNSLIKTLDVLKKSEFSDLGIAPL